MSISVANISKYYGKQKALNGLNFSLKKGEICGFLGPNGAGKSTLMKIITGYLTDYEGQITAGGIDIRQYPLKAKKIIGYLPEHNPLYPDMYIKEYLSHIAKLYRIKDAEKKSEQMIELIGLSPERNKKIGQLSKGYRQRVGLAQALIHDPEILILDEPMTGLDPNQLEEIRNLIIRIGQDKTVMLSTHIMQEVEAICDRIIIINKGNIITDELKKELHQSTRNSLLIDIRFVNNQMPEWLGETAGVISVTETGSGSLQVVAEAGSDPRIGIFNAAALHQLPIIELKVEERNLEDVFKELTQNPNEVSL